MVVGAVSADEHSGPAAVQCRRVDIGPLECFPGRFEQHPLLRVHLKRLARRYAEEVGVEIGGGIDESAFIGPVGWPCQAPSPVIGELPHRVDAVAQEFPQRFWGVRTAGIAAAHPDYRDRLAARLGQIGDLLPAALQLGRHSLQVLDNLLFISHLPYLFLKAEDAD